MVATLLALAGILACPMQFLGAQARTNGVTNYLNETPASARHGMVVTIQHDASDAGVAMLREGGNAVDAAVAVGFALAVVHPAAGNLGGGGFMLLRMARNGETHFIDFREEAPAAATADMYLDAHGNVIPNASTVGIRSLGVPGSVAGFVYAETHFGRLNLAQVMAPAIHLARDGYALSEEEAQNLRAAKLAQFAESKRIFQRDGNYYKPGEVFCQPELAQTLERIAANPESFYHGALAREIVAFIERQGGLIREQDLASYTVKERAPLVGSYRGYTILTAPPPSSGGVTLLETLNMLDGIDLRKMGDRSPLAIHWIVEAFRRAYMDRSDYAGDTDFVAFPVAQMLNPAYDHALAASINPEKATPSALLRRPAGFLPNPTNAPAPAAESNNTTHFSVVDADRDAVAVTYTLNASFGSGETVSGLGFLLNDEMDDFTAKVGAPNMYGLVQASNNAIGPGRRPVSSMTPTIVLGKGVNHDKVWLVLGSPGGATIATTVTNDLIGVVNGGLNIQQAVDAPRFHHQYLPDQLRVEPGLPQNVIDALKKMNYPVVVAKSTWGDSECIAVDQKTGLLEGGQDHRQNFGKAAGY